MKIFTGRVIATKMAKTATVAVERVVIHPLYKKRLMRDTKYQVHDESGAKIGDVVKFTASKPYSKSKKWKVLEVVASKKSEISNPTAKLVTKSETISKDENPKLKKMKKGDAK